MTAQLRHLLDTLCTAGLTIDPASLADDSSGVWQSIPASPGVVIFEGDADRPLLIRALADPRAFVRRRLDPDEKDDTPSARTDFGAVTSRIRVLPTGHLLLAEMFAMMGELALDPVGARASADRFSACVVRCDPTARLPTFAIDSLSDLWSGRSMIGRHDALIGPFAHPKRARHWIEGVTDLFDLCRFEHLLAQTPHATACVYKQMGKCPAPCDGSEPVESYRDRFRRASRFFGSAVEAEMEGCTRQMEDAASSLDFERAGALKDRLLAIRSLDTGGPWQVTDVLACRWGISGPTQRPGWTRHSTLSPGAFAVTSDRRDAPSAPREETGTGPIVTGPQFWLLLAVLLDRMKRGLSGQERVEQTTPPGDPGSAAPAAGDPIAPQSR